MNKKITLIDWGLKDYKEAWEAQEALFQATIDQKTANRSAENPSPTPNYLIFVEHPHVLTLGKSGVMEHLLMSDEFLKAKHISFYKVKPRRRYHLPRTGAGSGLPYTGLGQLLP